MYKRILLGAVAVAIIATVAVAGTMTSEELTKKIANCPNCKAMANYPDLMTTVKPDIFKTETGFVSTFLVSDEKALPACQKWEQECEANSKKPELASSLCPVCISYGNLMMNKEVKMESFVGTLGRITVASSNTKSGTDALHAHVTLMNEAKAVMPAAMTEIMKTVKPKTTTASDN